MKHIIRTAAVCMLLLCSAIPISASASPYPIFTGTLIEGTFRKIAEAEDVYVVEINGIVWTVPKPK